MWRLPLLISLSAVGPLGAQDSTTPKPISLPAGLQMPVGTIWYRGETAIKDVHGASGTRAQASAVIVKVPGGGTKWIGLQISAYLKAGVYTTTRNSYIDLDMVPAVLIALEQFKSFDTSATPAVAAEMHYAGPGGLEVARYWSNVEGSWHTSITVGTFPFTETAYLREKDFFLLVDAIRAAQSEAAKWR